MIKVQAGPLKVLHFDLAAAEENEKRSRASGSAPPRRLRPVVVVMIRRKGRVQRIEGFGVRINGPSRVAYSIRDFAPGEELSRDRHADIRIWQETEAEIELATKFEEFNETTPEG